MSAEQWYLCGTKVDNSHKAYIDCIGPFNNALIADDYYQKGDCDPSQFRKSTLPVCRFIPDSIKSHFLIKKYNDIFSPTKIIMSQPKAI